MKPVPLISWLDRKFPNEDNNYRGREEADGDELGQKLHGGDRETVLNSQHLTNR